jgi:hypothetical protein
MRDDRRSGDDRRLHSERRNGHGDRRYGGHQRRRRVAHASSAVRQRADWTALKRYSVLIYVAVVVVVSMTVTYMLTR